MKRKNINRNATTINQKTIPCKEKETNEKSSSATNIWSITVVLICVIITALNTYQFYHIEKKDGTTSVQTSSSGNFSNTLCKVTEKPTYVIYGKSPDTSHLKHVFAVLDRLGFERSEDITSSWDLLWAHDYPFRELHRNLRTLDIRQKVNHFPGSGYITNKVDLATSGLSYIPPAFRVPEENGKLLRYAESHPNVTYVQKDNNHRGIELRTFHDIDLNTTGTFIQVYIDNPYLVDGHKFDIGVYTILTSVDPIRLYIYNGDILFRFCPEKYHPFDPKVIDKYIIGDDYLPIWQVPSLQKYYVDQGFSMKESFNAYVREQGSDPGKVWSQVNDSIYNLYLKKEEQLIRSASHYRSKNNFFELVRIDFVVDEDLNVHLMEANMSPNLSSAHYPPNVLLYEQVLFNLMSLVGIGRHVHGKTLKHRDKEEESMQVADKNIAVYPDVCTREQCLNCLPLECQLCRTCMTAETKATLKTAYLEHVNRQDCRRVFPPSMTLNSNINVDIEEYSPENRLMYLWFRGKCHQDQTWCS